MDYRKRRADLIANGFREHKNDRTTSVWKYDMLFQKKVTDENGVRYFVDAMCYFHQNGSVDGWEIEVNYNDGCAFCRPGMAMKICGFALKSEWTAANVIEWADELWQRLAPSYYERNQ